MYKKNPTTVRKITYLHKNKTNEKKPCKTCESLDKGIRYHPDELCWFKKNEIEPQKVFRARNVNNNSIIEVDMNTEKKNE